MVCTVSIAKPKGYRADRPNSFGQLRSDIFSNSSKTLFSYFLVSYCLHVVWRWARYAYSTACTSQIPTKASQNRKILLTSFPNNLGCFGITCYRDRSPFLHKRNFRPTSEYSWDHHGKGRLRLRRPSLFASSHTPSCLPPSPDTTTFLVVCRLMNFASLQCWIPDDPVSLAVFPCGFCPFFSEHVFPSGRLHSSFTISRHITNLITISSWLLPTRLRLLSPLDCYARFFLCDSIANCAESLPYRKAVIDELRLHVTSVPEVGEHTKDTWRWQRPTYGSVGVSTISAENGFRAHATLHWKLRRIFLLGRFLEVKMMPNCRKGVLQCF